MARRKGQEEALPDCGPPDEEDYANLIVMKRTRYIHYEFSIDGFRHRGSTRKTTKPEAAAVVRHKRKVAEAEALLHADRRGRDGLLLDMTLKAAADRFMRESGDRDVGAANTKRLVGRLRAYLGDATPLSRITNERVAGMVARIRELRHHGRPLSQGYIDMHVGLLQRIFGHARRKWEMLLPREPDWREHKGKKRPRRRPLSFEEQIRIGRSMPEDFEDAYWFVCLTGLRRTDAVEVRWSEVDFAGAVIRLEVKGDKPVEVDISPEVEAILRAQEGRDAEFVFTFAARRNLPRGRGGTVIGYRAGERYRMRSKMFYYQFKKAAAAEGIADARPHDLRKMMGNHTYRATGDIVAAQERLHHASVRTTRDDYLYVSTEHTRKAVATTNAYVAGGLTRAARDLARREGRPVRSRAFALAGLESAKCPEETPKGMRNACGTKGLSSTSSMSRRNSTSEPGFSGPSSEGSASFCSQRHISGGPTGLGEAAADGNFHESSRKPPLQDANPRSFPEVPASPNGLDAGALEAGAVVTHQGMRGRFREVRRKVACRLDEAFEPTPMERVRKAGHTVWAFEPEDGSVSDQVVVVGERHQVAVRGAG